MVVVLQIGSIWANWFYLGKLVLFGEKWSDLGKRWLYLGKRWCYLGKGGCNFANRTNRTKCHK